VVNNQAHEISSNGPAAVVGAGDDVSS